MKAVVITGSTRGIGYGLADSFLTLGCAVTISGRSAEGVENAVATLAMKHESDRLFGHSCDVTDFDQVQILWDNSKERFSRVDIWVNNAGVSNPQADFWHQSPKRVADVVNTNVLGAMYGSLVALQGMMEQGFGGLYNMEGLGSDGRTMRGLAPYGTSKAGLAYLTRSLARETKGTAVVVGGLRPGMVLTELITKEYEGRPDEWERFKPILNILAERVETVTPWLAGRVLTNTKNGVTISWLTRRKVFFRFLMSPFRKRRLFD